MIGRLQGKLAAISGGFALVDINGVGYEVTIPLSILPELPTVGESVTLIIRQIFREDSVSLYGFANLPQRSLFDLLLDVKGCGPKFAMALLGTLGPDAIARAIQMNDSRTLSRAPGVGPKLAERICLELKDKIQEHIFDTTITQRAEKPLTRDEDELVEALLGLGYRRFEAESAAQTAREATDDLQSQIKFALQSLKK